MSDLDNSVYNVGKTIDVNNNIHGFGFKVVGDDTYVLQEHDAEKYFLSEISNKTQALCRKNGQAFLAFIVPFGPNGDKIIGIAGKDGASFVKCDKTGKIHEEFTKEDSTYIEQTRERINNSIDNQAASAIAKNHEMVSHLTHQFFPSAATTLENVINNAKEANQIYSAYLIDQFVTAFNMTQTHSKEIVR